MERSASGVFMKKEWEKLIFLAIIICGLFIVGTDLWFAFAFLTAVL